MRLTPLDIQQKQFPMRFRGFDVDEVYSFLELVREELEELLRENGSLKEQLARADEQLQEFRHMESTLRETLMTAQQKVVKIHEDIVDLKGIRRHFKEEIKRLIDSHMKMLEFDKEREGEGSSEI